jgi:hypothetical protein
MCMKWQLVIATENGHEETIQNIPATTEDMGTVYRAIRTTLQRDFNDDIKEARVWSQPETSDVPTFQYTIL